MAFYLLYGIVCLMAFKKTFIIVMSYMKGDKV